MEPPFSLDQYLTAKTVGMVSLSSVALLLVGIVGTPYILINLPEDYFLHEKPHLGTLLRQSNPVKCCIILAKNLLGMILLLLGLAMLVLPGQGILTILVALILMDFHGKKRLLRRLAGLKNVLRSINWLRRRYKRRPLRF